MTSANLPWTSAPLSLTIQPGTVPPLPLPQRSRSWNKMVEGGGSSIGTASRGFTQKIQPQTWPQGCQTPVKEPTDGTEMLESWCPE